MFMIGLQVCHMTQNTGRRCLFRARPARWRASADAENRKHRSVLGTHRSKFLQRSKWRRNGRRQGVARVRGGAVCCCKSFSSCDCDGNYCTRVIRDFPDIGRCYRRCAIMESRADKVGNRLVRRVHHCCLRAGNSLGYFCRALVAKPSRTLTQARRLLPRSAMGLMPRLIASVYRRQLSSIPPRRTNGAKAR